MKILVTGGAGFVGSNLCEALAKDPNNEVYSLDNYFTGSRDNHVEGVTYIEGSTEHIFELIDFVPNLVYHLGEYSRVEQSFGDIDKVLLFNKIGTLEVLEFCRKRHCKLVYAGSSTKFGDGGLGKDQSPYAWSKSSNTELIKNYGNWYGLQYAIVYFYNVYGKREIRTGKYATLIALFTEKMKKGIGSPETYTVLEIAQLFGGEIQMLPERKGNRMTAEVVTKKTEALGWKAKRHIKEFIEEEKHCL